MRPLPPYLPPYMRGFFPHYPPMQAFPRFYRPYYPTPPTSSPFNLNQFMQQAGQLMQSAQKYAPYFQQARPMLKNLPALWRMYKSFKSLPSENEDSPPVLKRRMARPKKEKIEEVKKTSNNSYPKVYQPPFEI